MTVTSRRFSQERLDKGTNPAHLMKSLFAKEEFPQPSEDTHTYGASLTVALRKEFWLYTQILHRF